MGLFNRGVDVEDVGYLTFYKEEKNLPQFVNKAYAAMDEFWENIDAYRGTENAVIAGGVFQAILANQMPRDIDVFVDEMGYRGVLTALTDSHYTSKKHYTNSAVPNATKACVLVKDSYPDVNLISVTNFKPEEILDTFDITVAGCAMTMDYMCWHPYFEEDSLTRRLRFFRYTDDPFQTMMRYTKYARKGFESLPEDLESICKNIWGMEEIGDFNEQIKARKEGRLAPLVASNNQSFGAYSHSPSYTSGS